MRHAIGMVASILLPLSVIGCGSTFIPTYDEALYKSIEGIGSNLQKIETATLVINTKPTPFSKVEPYYIGAFSNLDEAQKILDGQRDYYRNKIPEGPILILKQALDNCRAAMKLQLDRHQSAPISRDLIVTFATIDTCSVPKMMQARLKGSE